MKLRAKRYPHSGLSRRVDFTGDMGYLYPFNFYEVLPGDTFQASTLAMVKCNQLLAQVQTPCKVTIAHFYVPYRLIWDDAQNFFTGGEDGMDVFDLPTVQPGTVTEGSFWDILGFAPGAYGTRAFNALIPRTYSSIINHYFHDQDLMTERTIDTTSGPDTTTTTTIAPMPWSKDYFSAARPFTQRGDDLTIPVGEDAPVKYDGSGASSTNSFGVLDGNDSYRTMTATTTNVTDGTTLQTDSNYQLYADLSQATGLAIDDFRLTIAMQRMYERMGRNGYRYSDYLKSMGLPSSDARLNQPELLGLGKNVITFSEVLSQDGTNTGDEYGHGQAVMKTNRFRRYFEEHGIMMSIMGIMPKPLYTQALDRVWLKTTKEDFFIPELQHIGEMTITNQEAYSLHSSPDNAWGYLPRNEDYREAHDRIAGELNTTQNHVHMGRIYTGDVALNESWLTTTPTKRIFGAPGTDSLKIITQNSVQARRMVSPMGRAKTI